MRYYSSMDSPGRIDPTTHHIMKGCSTIELHATLTLSKEVQCVFELKEGNVLFNDALNTFY